MASKTISTEDLLKFGFVSSSGDSPFVFEKDLTDREEHPKEEGIMLVVANPHNETGFYLVFPDGAMLKLLVDDLEELSIVEKSIGSWIPNY